MTSVIENKIKIKQNKVFVQDVSVEEGLDISFVSRWREKYLKGNSNDFKTGILLKKFVNKCL